jgi:hypothetical protein
MNQATLIRTYILLVFPAIENINTALDNLDT